MKKLLKVSLVAMLVATPMVASAALPGNVTYSDGNTTKPTITANTNVATTSYVQGAYDAAIDAVSAENARATTAEGAIDTKVGSLDTLTTGENGNFTAEQKADLATAVNAAMATAKAAAAGSNETIGDLSSLGGDFGAGDTGNTAPTTVVGALDSLDDRTDALETTVGDSSSGLVKRVGDLETTMGDTALVTGNGTTDLAATTVTAAINELQTDKLEKSKATVATTSGHLTAGDDVAANLGALNTAIGTNETAITNITNGTTGISYTNANMSGVTTVAGALDALKTEVTGTNIGTRESGTYISTSNTVSQDLKALDTAVKGNADHIGTVGSLTTTAKTDLVGAINEVDAKVLSVWGTWGSANSTGEAALMDPTQAGTGSNPASGS